MARCRGSTPAVAFVASTPTSVRPQIVGAAARSPGCPHPWLSVCRDGRYHSLLVALLAHPHSCCLRCPGAGGPDDCIDGIAAGVWINSPDVVAALHVGAALPYLPNKKWTICSSVRCVAPCRTGAWECVANWAFLCFSIFGCVAVVEPALHDDCGRSARHDLPGAGVAVPRAGVQRRRRRVCPYVRGRGCAWCWSVGVLALTCLFSSMYLRVWV